MSSPQRLRVAIAQPVISADARENGRTVRRLMREAAAVGARLAQFPEGCLSGYAKEQIADWDDVDWSVVREELELTAALAADLRLWTVLGSAHPLTPPNRPHNSLYVIADDGRVVDRYDKRYCSNTEILDFFTPGFDAVTFEVDGMTFGLAICIEVNFPELFAEYERLGVDCLLLSAYPVDAIFEVKARAHAAINNYWLAMSVPSQVSELLDSELIGPDGTLLARMGRGSELVFGELDRSAPKFGIALNRARPWRSEARQGDIYQSRRVDDPRSRDRTSF